MKFNQNIQFLESVSTPSSVLMYMEKVQDSLSNARFWLNYTLALQRMRNTLLKNYLKSQMTEQQDKGQECTVSVTLNVLASPLIQLN